MYSEKSGSETPAHGNFNFIQDEILMQFTGVSDKMCKDIYEGDILEGANGVIYKVFFFGGSFMASVENHCYKDRFPMPYHLMQFQMSSIKVIGNIYETPELLKS
jgi:uncharacterized phage protein (TIGR01671 family)